MEALTLNQIEAMLKIDKHRLDDELEKQSQILYNITESLAERTYAYNMAKDELEKHEAEMFIRCKDRNSKSTRDEILAEIALDDDRIELFAKLCVQERLVQKWQGMQDSWKQRGFALKALADLAIANYYSVDTTYENNRKIIADSKQTTPSRRRETHGRA